MVSYKEPFQKAWIKLLKNELFPKLINCVQPIRLDVHVGKGWDWLSDVPYDGCIISIDINEAEMVQCNHDDTSFIGYINFGKGYKYLKIPFSSIYTIYIGNGFNWITNPIKTTPFDLSEIDQINLLEDSE